MNGDNKKRFSVGKLNGGLASTGTQVIVDTATGVQYLFALNGYGGGLTLLVDTDGKPLIDKSAVSFVEYDSSNDRAN